MQFKDLNGGELFLAAAVKGTLYKKVEKDLGIPIAYECVRTKDWIPISPRERGCDVLFEQESEVTLVRVQKMYRIV